MSPPPCLAESYPLLTSSSSPSASRKPCLASHPSFQISPILLGSKGLFCLCPSLLHWGTMKLPAWSFAFFAGAQIWEALDKYLFIDGMIDEKPEALHSLKMKTWTRAALAGFTRAKGEINRGHKYSPAWVLCNHVRMFQVTWVQVQIKLGPSWSSTISNAPSETYSFLEMLKL